MKTRILAEHTEIAHHMGEFFIPSDCADDEILIRKGKIFNRDKDVIYEIIMAYTNDRHPEGWNLMVISKEDHQWQLHMGSTPKFLKDAVQPLTEGFPIV
jgi:hypothetical protein